MKEEEFFNDLRNLVWDKFPYCKINKRKKDYTLAYLKNFENIIIIEVEFIYINFSRCLRYYVNVNEIKKKGNRMKMSLALQVINDIKKFKIDDID